MRASVSFEHDKMSSHEIDLKGREMVAQETLKKTKDNIVESNTRMNECYPPFYLCASFEQTTTVELCKIREC